MLKNLAISFIGIIISLLFLELVMRFVLIPASQSPRWNDRPDAYYRKKISGTDENGTPKKTEDTYRIAAVGDSITYGPNMQSDDVYAKKLERILNLNGNNKKVEVINYGVSGYATSHEVNVVKRAIVEQADLVLLQITLNDPELTPLDIQHENTVQRFGPLKPGPVLSTVMKYWQTLAFVLNRLHNTRTQYEYKKYFYDLYENKESWDVFYNSLKKISEMAKNSNVPFGAVIFPLFGQDINDNYSFKEIHAKINGALDELGIQHLDLLPFFTNIPAARLQVIPGVDFHPNEIGHRIAAENIYRWLKSTKLLPKDFVVENSTHSR
jgi:lysophospholipase L1-like esterase